MAASDKKLQSFYAFNAGEYSKDLAGRTDLESFASSTRYTSNFLTQVSGGLKKFYGTRHITEQTLEEGFSKIKLIPFINKYEPMALVIYGRDDNVEYDSDESLKVGLIYGDNYTSLDNIELPNSIDVNELRWKQINDKIILCHKSIQPMAINFYGIGDDGNYDFRSETILFKEIPYFPIGTTDEYQGALQANALTGSVELTIPTGSDVGSYFPSLLLSSATYKRTYSTHNANPILSFHIDNSTISVFRVRSGNVTTLVSNVACNIPYVHQHHNSEYIDASDTITQETIKQAVQTVYPEAFIDGPMLRLKGITDHVDGDSYYMTLSVGRGYLLRSDTQATQTKWNSATYTGTPYTPIPITTGTIDAQNVIGRKIKFFFNDDTEIIPWWQGRVVASAGEYAYSNGHWYKSITSGTCGNIQPSHTFGVRSDGAVSWAYVHSGSTSATVVEVVSDSKIRVLVPSGLELPKCVNNIYTNYAWSIWGKDGIHPSDVYMVGNRLCFVCNTLNFGSWNAMSVTDDYFNFSTEEYGEQLDTSAIVHLVGNNESSDINWVLARSDVYMGGYSGEYHLASGTQNKRGGAYTPITTFVQNISNIGGKSVVPLKYKELNMFVGVTGKELYTIGYDYTIDDYTPKSLGYLTQHIMSKGIKRMEALNNLDRNIYLLHETQELSLFNYAAEQKVMGFSELDFADKVIDFVTTYAKDEVAAYVVVQRNTGKITIERFAIANPNYMFDEITQGDGTLADFQPIPHFANRTVYIRYGENFSQFTKVDLDENGDISHDIYSGVYLPQAEYFKVGIPMVVELHTQPAFGNKVEGHQQQSLSVYIRLVDSGAFNYGSSVDFSKYFRHEYWNTQQEYSVEHRLFTGDMKLDIPLGYAEAQNQGEGPYPNTSAVGINIKSDTPEPLNILSMQEIYR